ncbi:YeeE/YedE thiosulfate transporter family protein [Erythrobacter donghaensis]|uniref:YeeE/YedE thiosulfate transporter family protein n=1 Tax=Erythrobacter donghaensis TaxID=267135 RepID=UPI000A3C3CC3|nr:YeeE/YedE thiosulfate transporter family protein [Erythrobacter donghaensis]
MLPLSTTALLFLIGYSSQRSGVCMLRAVREVIERRRVHRLAGFTLAAAMAMVVMALAGLGGARPFAMIPGTAPDAIAVAGGVLFGLGSLLSGYCAMGTLAALTAGDLSRMATIAAMFAAALLLGPEMSSAALMLPPRAIAPSPLVGHAGVALAVGGMLAVLATGYIHRRIGWRSPRGGWSPLIAMGLIGGASGLLFAADRNWVYTSRIADLAYGRSALTLAVWAGPLVLLAGMTIAAITGGMFRLRKGSRSDWARATSGGLLMGAGATLVPGGNDTMLFTGVTLLLPNLLLAYAAFVATLFAALMIRRARG